MFQPLMIKGREYWDDVRMCKYADVQMYGCADVQICRYADEEN
jgi:hypothetical protein